MISPITSKVIKHIPYAGPVFQTIGIALDAKEIIESSTPMGAVKTISMRFVKECTPPEIYFGGRCVMLVGSVVASVASAGNPLLVSGTLSAACSIVKDV